MSRWDCEACPTLDMSIPLENSPISNTNIGSFIGSIKSQALRADDGRRQLNSMVSFEIINKDSLIWSDSGRKKHKKYNHQDGKRHFL